MDYKKFDISEDHFVAHASINYKQEEKLFAFVEEKKLDQTRLRQFGNPKRKVEWMSVRYLLNLLLPNFEDIEYEASGKPSLKNSSHHLSISHSHEKIAISVSKNHSTAVDIQLINPKIIRIKNKFLNPSELELINEVSEKELTILWSIKEALFKIEGNQDLFLKPNFLIEAINQENDAWFANAKSINGGQIKEYQLGVKMINNYILAYLLNS
jgi:phosphopantetheinyl transferase